MAGALVDPVTAALREAVTEALAARRAALEGEALERRLATETLDMTLPVAPPAEGPSAKSEATSAKPALRETQVTPDSPLR